MSTPTASTAAQPSSASKKTTDHVTTPSRLGLASPAPRSIPSPAATRKDQAGKTPTNHPTASSFGSKTLGGTPMVQSLSQSGHPSSGSPGAHIAGFTPGHDMGSTTPGQMNMPTPLGGSVPMGPSMSDFGLSASGGAKRNEDEERRAKLRRVMKIIGKRKGRASKENLDRLARRIGFDTSPDETELGMAGKLTVVTLLYKAAVLQNINTLIFSDTSGQQELKGYQAGIGSVLMRDLWVPDGIQLHSNLDRFAVNLDRLARMDRLSADVNCFAAVHGLYESLNRLHELEQRAVREARPGFSEPQARSEATRKKSGRPGLHTRRRIGLILDYWSTDEIKAKADHSQSAMDIDDADKTGEDEEEEATPEIFSLRLEAEGSPAPMYPSLRISDAWLPETFELPAPDLGGGIPWQDPPPTFLPHDSTNGQDSMAMDDSQRLPNLRFVAKLDPPVVMPFQTAMNILSAVGAQPTTMYGVPLQYYAMVLGISPQAGVATDIQADQTVLAVRTGEEVDVRHHYALDVSKADFGYKLEEFPFSHPRQVVELLPTLRQWAHAGALLQNAMKSNSTSNKTATLPSDGVTNGDSSNAMDLDGLLGSSASPNTLNVDTELSTTPHPTFSIVFSDPETSEVSNVTLQVQTNADIVVTEYAGIGDESDVNEETAKKFARALAICGGDLGMWIEWLRQRKSKQQT